MGGASELDVVMNISKFLSGESSYVTEEIASLTQEAGLSPGIKVSGTWA